MPILASRLFSKLSPRHSIKARLIWNTVSLVLVLSLLLSLLVGYVGGKEIEINREQFLEQLAYQMADKLEQGMFERYKDIQVLSTLNSIRQSNSSVADTRTLLEKLQKLYPDYAWIGLTDTQGKVVASTGGLLEGKDASQRPWFEQALTKPYVGDVHEALLLAKLLPNPDDEPLRFVDVAAPVVDESGNFQGVLCAHLSWNWAKDVQSSLAKTMTQQGFANIFILSKDGDVLLAPPGFESEKIVVPRIEQTDRDRASYFMDTDRARRQYLTGFAYSEGYKDYPGLGWIVLVRQNKDLAFAPVRSLQQQVLGAGLLMGILFATLSWLSAKRISEPIISLATVADRIRQGENLLKIPVFKGRDELATLSKSLIYMIGTLNDREQTLKTELERRQQAEASLFEQKELLQTIVDNIPVMLAFFDADSQFQWVNRQWEELTGWSFAEAKQQDMLAKFYPDPDYRQSVIDFIQSASQTWGEFETRLRDGRTIDVLWANIELSDGTSIGIGQDISDRKERERELQRQALIFEAIEDAVILTDLDGRIIDWNRGATKLFGYGKAEVLGQTPSLLHKPEESARLTQDILAGMKERGSWTGEINFVRKNGTEGICETIVVPQVNERGELTNTIGVNHDITERKRRESILKDIASGVTVPTGSSFFASLVEYLSRTLRVNYAFIGELVQPDANSIRTLAVYGQGKPMANLEYSVAGTPCEVVLGKQKCIYPKAVQQLFPGDLMLRDIGAESYAGMPILDTEGTPFGLISIIDSKPFEDLTLIEEVLKIFATRATSEIERIKVEISLKQSEQKFKAIFDKSFQFMGLLEPDGKVIEINQTALDFVGLTIADVADKPFWSTPWWTISQENQDLCRQAVTRAAKGEFIRFEVNYRGTEDRSIKVDFSLTPIEDERGEVVLLIPEGRDISKLQAAEAANLAKSQFLANMSHELRTPLNAILGFSQLMSRDSSLERSHLANLEIINRSGKHLLELINDILDLSKIEAGKITLQENEFNLRHLLEDLEAMFGLRARTKNLKLNFELDNCLPTYIKADEKKLRQVLINILGNAIKFTEVGSVTLRGTIAEDSLSKTSPITKEGEFITLSLAIEDTGVGIAPSEIDKLFKPFAQSQAGYKAQEGTGLGLAISDRFIKLMGGEITVSSLIERGTTFQLDIPVQLASEQESITVSSRRVIGIAPNQPTYRILIAEDEPANRQLLSTLLKSAGFEVREATNGQEAISIWSSWSPQLIWMDLRMPIMNGDEATRIIKQTPQGRSTIIIALTASIFAEHRHSILSAGCDDLVNKPFQAEEIFNKMSQYLGVEYLYEELSPTESATVDSSYADPASLTYTDLTLMPQDWIERLHQAATSLDGGEVAALIAQIPPEHLSLSAALTELLNRVRFDVIVEITKPIA